MINRRQVLAGGVAAVASAALPPALPEVWTANTVLTVTPEMFGAAGNGLMSLADNTRAFKSCSEYIRSGRLVRLDSFIAELNGEDR